MWVSRRAAYPVWPITAARRENLAVHPHWDTVRPLNRDRDPAAPSTGEALHGLAYIEGATRSMRGHGLTLYCRLMDDDDMGSSLRSWRARCRDFVFQNSNFSG